MHVADLHFTICMMAGLTEVECRDDDIPGVPPVDGVDFRNAFSEVNTTRPIAGGNGASAGTQEIVLSSNILLGNGKHSGAYIDFNLSNGGPWKLVRNTTHVLKNKDSPLGSGYWTGPVWPVGNNHTPLEADPGCPEGGCLFNLRIDRTEHREFSAEQPALKAQMQARLEELLVTQFQTGINYTAGQDNCTGLATVVEMNCGFVAPCCSKGKSWSADISCGMNPSRIFERYGVSSYRGRWSCENGSSSLFASDALTAGELDNAAVAGGGGGGGGGSIGFARIKDVKQPAPRSHTPQAMEMGVEMRLLNATDAASCGYLHGGVIIGMGIRPGAVGSNFRDEFAGYSIAVTAPVCGGKLANVEVVRHDVGGARGEQPTNKVLVRAPFDAVPQLGNVSTLDWFHLAVSTNATHIIVKLNDLLLVTTLQLPGKPIGCVNGIVDMSMHGAPQERDEEQREPWEPRQVVSADSQDACAVGVYHHRTAVMWQNFTFS